MARKSDGPILVPLVPQSGPRSRWSSPRFRSLVITLFVATAVAIGGVWGFRTLWRRVINLQEFSLVPGEQEIRDLAGKSLEDLPWLDVANLRAYWLTNAGDPTGVLSQSTSLFASNLAERVHGALAHSPWVRPATARDGPNVLVRRRFPNRLEIRVRLRQPAFLVLVKDAKTQYLVDDEGVVLDRRIFRPTPEVSRRPPLRFVFEPSEPDIGKRWEDDGLLGAMELARVLADRGTLARTPLKEVLIESAQRGNTGYNRSLTLALQCGGRVVWGSPAPDGKIPSPAEASPEEKYRNLVDLLARTQATLPQSILDLRLRTPTVRPLPPPDSSAGPPAARP